MYLENTVYVKCNFISKMLKLNGILLSVIRNSMPVDITKDVIEVRIRKSKEQVFGHSLTTYFIRRGEGGRLYFIALIISTKLLACNAAPPINPPSISGCSKISFALSAFTLPP